MSERDNQDNGSVWTSYSDMFTTMAIIFLVMFVFALLRSGVSTLSALQEKKEKEEFIKGKISQKEIERDMKVMQSLEKEITEMDDFNQIIDAKITQINQFSKKMKQHKELVKKSLEKQNKTHVALLNARKVIKEHESKIVEQTTGIKKLNSTVKNLKKETAYMKVFNLELEAEKKRVENILTTERDDLKKKLQREVSVANTYKGQVSKQSHEILQIKKKIEAKIRETKELDRQIASLEQKLQDKKIALTNSQYEVKTSSRKIKELERKVAAVEKHSNQLSKSLTSKTTELDRMQQNAKSLQETVADQQNKIVKSEKIAATLQSKLNYSSNENSRLKKEMKSILGSESELKMQLMEARSKLGQAEIRNKRVARGIASVKENMRSKIGAKIAEKLKGSNLNVVVDPHTGNVTLRMDDSFRFKRNSAKLSRSAKQTLKKIIPLYSQAVFGDPAVAKYIQGVNIVGHASPRYQQQYISPSSDNHNEAYNYNMVLSSARAETIVMYVFSRHFGRFDNKATFRKKVAAIGRSFSEPVRRSPASKINGCGIYDCAESRRVEITFTLKENNKIWNKLEGLN